jgi:hypothetical protein
MDDTAAKKEAIEKMAAIRKALSDVSIFAQNISGIRLRSYQRQVACAIVDSIHRHKGFTFVVIFPRQSGKNELQAQIETYVMLMCSKNTAEMVKVSPTWKPQAMNAMRRLERILKRNYMTKSLWKREQGYIYNLGQSRIYFLSGSPPTNVVGQTASVLLECDEAQDVLIDKWDKEIAPMAASTNATRVFWGTAWTSQTLLAREKRLALEAQKKDGIQRVFEINADLVRKEAKAYGKFVDGEVAKHGRNHPFIKTQYYSEEIDETGGMFPPERIALIHGDHDYQVEPLPGRLYAFCLDVAGSDENSATINLSDSGLTGSGRDQTALTIFEIVLPGPGGVLPPPGVLLPGDFLPAFHIVHRRSWSGASQVALFNQIYSLAQHWQPYRLVIDATGVGEGLSSFLARSFPNQVIPFKFSQASKSDLGWRLLSAIETGRFKDFAPCQYERISRSNLGDLATTDQGYLQQLFYSQLRLCTLELLPGPGKIIRWSVPEGAHDPQSNDLIHDDLLISAALSAALFDEKGLGRAESAVIKAYDPISEMSY